MTAPAMWGWNFPGVYFPLPFFSALLGTGVLSVNLVNGRQLTLVLLKKKKNAVFLLTGESGLSMLTLVSGVFGFFLCDSFFSFFF